jgi:predicted Fe-Mo cluster-binding NifX family protein
MNVVFPVLHDQGLASNVSPHFGSASVYLVVDTATRTCRAILNTNRHHEHGCCQPLGSLGAERADAYVVGGIGAGALGQLAATGARVYGAPGATVREALDALAAGTITELGLDDACVRQHG